MQALLALCCLHVVPVWPSRLVSLSSSSPLLLAYRCRPYLLCAACMWCLFVPSDWSVCHPVALFYLPTGAGPTCSVPPACGAIWPSRLVSLSSSSPLLLAYRCRPYLLCAACMWCLFGPPDWSVCHPVALFYSSTGAGPTCSVPPACGVCLSLQTGQSVIQ